MESALQGILDDIQAWKLIASSTNEVSDYVRNDLMSQLELAETSITDALSTVQGDI